MVEYYQGDVLKIENQKDLVIVVSKDKYNEKGQVIACPIIKETRLLPTVQKVTYEGTEYYVLCDKMKNLNLNVRASKKMGQISVIDRMYVSDAIQCLFDY